MATGSPGVSEWLGQVRRLLSAAGMASMSEVRSPGLDVEAVAGPSGLFTILAMDHGKSLRRLLHTGDGPQADEHFLVTKRTVVELLAPHCSAVLLDAGALPPSGSPLRLPAGVSLIMGLDAADYDDVACPPPLPPPDGLLVQAVDAGAKAAKIVVYYDPRSPDAGQRRDVVTEIAARCNSRGLPLLVEPLPFPSTASPDPLSWPVITVVEDMAETGAGLLKLPVSAAADEPDGADVCASITAVLGELPWILLSSGVPYAQFMENLRAALLGGAAGFAAGRSLWGDLVADLASEAAALDAVQRIKDAAELTERLGRRRVR